MQRIDIPSERASTPSRTFFRTITPRRVAVLVAATLFALVLASPAAFAGDSSSCDKVKKGNSGQCYAWKKDC